MCCLIIYDYKSLGTWLCITMGWLVLLVRSSLIMFVFLPECVAILGVSPSVLLVVASLDVLARGSS